jgi:FtsH-binding integral membrane protein
MRWASQLGQEGNLPWMWALNGAASVLASFIAMVISTESSIRACVLTGAACYALGGILLSGKNNPASAHAALAGEVKPAPLR